MTMRLNDHGGLACTESGWALATLLVVAWLAAPAIALIRRGGWRALPTSLLGFVWLGFGVDFVIRFGLLGRRFGGIRERHVPLRRPRRRDGRAGARARAPLLGLLRPRLRRVGRAPHAGPAVGGRHARWRRPADATDDRARRVDRVLRAGVGLFPLPLALLTPMGIAGTCG
jgi:hypothetical protein